MNKLILVLVLGMFLITTVSAFKFNEIDNVKRLPSLNPDKSFDLGQGRNIEYNKLWEKYPNIEVKNVFGLGKTNFRGSLVEHTESCGVDCNSQLEVYHSGGELIQDKRFLRQMDDGSWKEHRVRSYQFSYWGDIDDYETQCSEGKPIYQKENDTYYTPQICEQVKVGTHEGWKPINVGEELPEGYYTIKLDAEKRPSWTYDWQIKTQGIWLEEWAEWGSESLWVSYTTGDDGSTDNTYSNWEAQTFTTTYESEVTGIKVKILVDGGGANSHATYHIYAVDGDGYPTGSPLMKAESEENFNEITNDVGGEWIDLDLSNTTILDSNTKYALVYPSAYNDLNHVIWRKDSSSPTYSKGNRIYSDDDATSWNNVTGEDYMFEIYGTNASITLNSPADASTSDTNTITFNATAGVTGGATLVNMSLWTNETGSWEVRNTTSFDYVYEDADIVAYWDFDETSGTSFNDSSSNNLDLTGDSGIASSDTGVIGTKADFSGGVYDAKRNTGIETSGNWVISFWLNGSNSGGDQYIIDNRVDGGTGNVLIRFDGSNFEVVDNANSNKVIDAKGDVLDGSWNHVLLSFEGTTLKYYLNGALTDTETVAVNTDFDTIDDFVVGGIRPNGGNDGVDYIFDMDEMFIINRSLTTDEITTIYNGGSGSRQLSGGTSSTQTWDRTITDDIIWNVQACDSDGDCGFATSNYSLSIDTTAPSIDILYPTGTQSFTNGQNVSLNYSISDTNLDSCWYSYNGANTSIGNCSLNNSFTYVGGVNEITLYANDSVGNVGSDTSTWSFLYTINSETHNTSTFETASEGFSINITANSSLTDVDLNYNGTEYALTQSGSVWSNTIQVPLSNFGNLSYRYTLTYAGTEYNSSEYYQNVSAINFTLCDNDTITNDFLNFTFKDETDLSVINSTMLLDIEYYLGDGTVNKSYTYQNTSELAEYGFCASPSGRTFNLVGTAKASGSSYPQRTFTIDGSYTSTVTERVLYLLNSGDGIYAQFQTLRTSNSQPISGVSVTVQRIISSVLTTIATGTTDDSGLYIVFVNPDFLHDFTFAKTGFGTIESSLTPTSADIYKVYMGAGDGQNVTQNWNTTTLSDSLSYSIGPQSVALNNGTAYNFTFTVSKPDISLTVSQDIYCSNGTLLDSSTVVSTSASLRDEVNTADCDYIYGV